MPPAGPPAAALSAEARRDLTTLRIFAHAGAVILRRQGASWVVAGANGCSVPPGRIERALDNLSALEAVPTDERPASGAFELEIVALVGEERALGLGVLDRDARGDLTTLGDGATARVRGLDRGLLSPNPRVWCEP